MGKEVGTIGEKMAFQSTTGWARECPWSINWVVKECMFSVSLPRFGGLKSDSSSTSSVQVRFYKRKDGGKAGFDMGGGYPFSSLIPLFPFRERAYSLGLRILGISFAIVEKRAMQYLRCVSKALRGHTIHFLSILPQFP